MHLEKSGLLLYGFVGLVVAGLIVVIFRSYQPANPDAVGVNKVNPFTDDKVFSTQAVENTKKPVGSAPPMDEAIRNLENKLEENPDDAEGWALLGRSYQFTNQPEKAQEAFRKAYELGSKDDSVTRGLTQTNEAKSEKYPDIKDHSLQDLSPYLDSLHGTSSGVEKPRNSLSTEVTEGNRDTSSQGKILLQGTVRLDPKLKNRVKPDDTVFVFARAVKGPRMPLAIIRKQVRDLPLVYHLDDGMAMTSDLKLSSFPEVVVVARISKSGTAMPEPGDIEGKTGVINIKSNERHDLVINKTIN